MESSNCGAGPDSVLAFERATAGLRWSAMGKPPATAYHPEEISQVWCNSQKEKQLAAEPRDHWISSHEPPKPLVARG